MNHKHVIPSIFTTLNAFLGFWSVIQVTQENFLYAAWFIILAVLCDGMDGKLARLADAANPLGSEMDSLADLISFGVAPAFLVYHYRLSDLKLAGVVISFLFVLGGIYRLARFNILQKGERSKGYSGLPIPVAAMLIAALIIILYRFDMTLSVFMWILVLASLTLLMVSVVPYAWPSLQFDTIKRRINSVCIFIGLVALIFLPRVALFPCIALYILLGVVNHLINSYFKIYQLNKHVQNNLDT